MSCFRAQDNLGNEDEAGAVGGGEGAGAVAPSPLPKASSSRSQEINLNRPTSEETMRIEAQDMQMARILQEEEDLQVAIRQSQLQQVQEEVEMELRTIQLQQIEEKEFEMAVRQSQITSEEGQKS